MRRRGRRLGPGRVLGGPVSADVRSGRQAPPRLHRRGRHGLQRPAQLPRAQARGGGGALRCGFDPSREGRRARAEGASVRGLARDAGEGGRRDRLRERGRARPSARDHRARGHAPRQARVLPEAALPRRGRVPRGGAGGGALPCGHPARHAVRGGRRRPAGRRFPPRRDDRRGEEGVPHVQPHGRGAVPSRGTASGRGRPAAEDARVEPLGASRRPRRSRGTSGSARRRCVRTPRRSTTR